MNIQIDVSAAGAAIREQGVLTVGMVGARVSFTFCEKWEGMIRTAVFRQGAVTVDVVLSEDRGEIPWEVLALPGLPVEIGVYGAAADGTRVIPTVWVRTHPVCPGADPSGDPGTDPSLPVWQQILNTIGDASSLAYTTLAEAIQNIDTRQEETDQRLHALKKDRMRIGVPLTAKDPCLNFDTANKTLSWSVNFFMEYNNQNYTIKAATLSYGDVGNIVYFCYNLNTKSVELTAPAGYDPESQVVVFAFVAASLKGWEYACTLPFPYMVNGVYVRAVEALPNPHKLTLTGAVEAEYDGSAEVAVEIPKEERSITLNPGEDIQTAVDAGYTTIVLNAGKYPCSPVTIRDIDHIKLVVPDAGYDKRKLKKNVVIDNSVDLEVTAGDTLLTAAFTAREDSNWYKVFVSQELPPQRTGLRSATYNAILWETDNANPDNDTKLLPVLTLPECEATAGSFYYAHDEGRVYIHPLTLRDTNVYKRLNVEEGSLFSVENVNTVYMENIEVKYAPEYLNLNMISNLTAVSCVVSHTAYEGGFKVNGVNGVFHGCEAYKVCADGFGIGGTLNGYTEYYNCTGHHCYDDGISHHNGSAGAIYGGVWHHNGKAGIAPSHGSVVNVYNAVVHDNVTGFFSKSDATVPDAMGRQAHYFNCIAYNNKYGIGVKNYHVTAYGCIFQDNAWQDTIIDSDSDAASTSLTII